mgnify:CR=1 FL=1
MFVAFLWIPWFGPTGFPPGRTQSAHMADADRPSGNLSMQVARTAGSCPAQNGLGRTQSMRVVVVFGPRAGLPRLVEEPEGAEGMGSQPRQLVFRTCL